MLRNYFDRWHLECQLEALGFHTNGLPRDVQQWDHAGLTTVVQMYGGPAPEICVWDRAVDGRRDMRFTEVEEALHFIERVLALREYGQAWDEYFRTVAA